jgi:hypothetical protein
MKNLLNIKELAEFLAANALGSCCERAAWGWVNANPKLIQRERRGARRVFFKRSHAKRLALAIANGKAKTP